MKKLTKLLVVSLASLTLVACRSNTDSSSNSISESKKTVKVGILQYMEHVSLSAARKGFEEELKAEGYKEGKT